MHEDAVFISILEDHRVAAVQPAAAAGEVAVRVSANNLAGCGLGDHHELATVVAVCATSVPAT